ncbi:DUF3040 domain-containing protein [Actinoplanes sp. GCM10030250]|uniref:DUF3040 domain-containing protein n=1 Tax=Actinoplanes sp. GCM10030250 TaxID=3273376 RepID=UPI00360C7EEF
MLDDKERRILAALERDLTHGDPGFAARMAGSGEERPFPAVSALCVLLFLAFPLVMLLFGWRGMVITLDVFAVALAVVLIRRRRRHH